jgi:EAL domain-containing protein (putative c-di-GMP-specific phosphodiesterase class I)
MPNKSERKLLRFNFLSSLIIMTFLAISFGSLGLFREITIMNKEIEDIEHNYMSTVKSIIRDRVFTTIEVITANMKILENEYRKTTYKKTIDTYNFINTLYSSKLVSGLDVSESAIINYLKSLNVDGNLIIFDKSGNTVFTTNKDLDPLALFSPLSKKKSINEGFLNLQGIKDKNGEKHNLVTYFKKYSPHQWTILSFYDRSEIENKIIAQIENLEFIGKVSEYITLMKLININGGKGFAKMLANTARKDLTGQYISDDVKDYEGVQFRKNYLKGLREKGESFAIYSYKKPGTDKVVKKINFFKLCKKLNWIVATGMYLDDVNKIVDIEKKALSRNIGRQIIISFFISLLFILVATSLLLSFSKKAKKMFRRYKISIDKKTKELDNANKELEKKLYFDELTGLPNKNKFLKDIAEISQPDKLFVAITEIVNFKILNNFYGFEVGDKIIEVFTNKSKKIMDENNFRFYRWKDDNFIIMPPNKNMKKEKIDELVNQFINYIAYKPILLPEYELEIDLNVTITVLHYDDRLFEKANIALDTAIKNNIPYLYLFDDKQVIQDYEDIIKWAKIAKKSLKENRIVPFFQPIIKDDRIEKYESLMRIINENNEIIPPGMFLNSAKKSRLYIMLSKQMIDKCFNLFINNNTSFTLNLSVEDILNDDMKNYIITMLKNFNIGNRLTFEITESESIENFEKVMDFILQVRNYGVKIALDDFGIGYSNFLYVIKLKPDYIKIDGSLIKDIDTNRQSEIMVKSIVNFSRETGIQTVAEFVHSEDVYKKCKSLEIDYFQGYFLGKPAENLKT